jgi:cyclic pyranopterin phosphate synthase
MPEEGMVWLNRSDLLSYEEISRLVAIFASLGVNKIRLTGGEPLMRKDVPLLVKQIAAVEGIKDIAVTTNGYFLAKQADDLANAGLNRINVSMDSLDAAKFAAMTRRDYLHKVWEGLNAAEKAGIRPIKVNVVLIRGINDAELEQFANLARTRPFQVRFIEFMPIGADDGWDITKVVPTKEVIERINRYMAGGPKLLPFHKHAEQPADTFRFEDGLGEIGFISSVSEPFCESCNRVRITSDGKLRTCLFSLHETDLRGMLRSGSSDEEIAEAITGSVWKKEEGHLINRPGFVRPDRTMSQIGG